MADTTDLIGVLKEERTAETFPELTKDTYPQIRGQQIPNWNNEKKHKPRHIEKIPKRNLTTDYLQKSIWLFNNIRNQWNDVPNVLKNITADLDVHTH